MQAFADTVLKIFRHRDSNPGRSGESRVPETARLQERLGFARGLAQALLCYIWGFWVPSCASSCAQIGPRPGSRSHPMDNARHIPSTLTPGVLPPGPGK